MRRVAEVVLPHLLHPARTRPFAATMALACSTMELMSTPMTSLAPARAAKMDRMPVPHPTSSTTLSLNRCLFSMIAFMYARVRTSSLSISSWMPCAREGGAGRSVTRKQTARQQTR